MTKNEINKKEKVINNDNYSKIYSEETNKNSNNSLNNNNTNNIRKDGKGIPITKKQLFKKTNHHAYLKDELEPGQSITHIVDIPSYKQYNIDSDIIEEEEDDEEEEQNNNIKIEINKEMTNCQCCICY